MADTNTNNYGLVKPGVGDPAGIDAWGGKLNNNFDTIDAVMKANADSIGLVFIQSVQYTGPSVANIEFTLPSGYKQFVILLDRLAPFAGAGGYFMIQFKMAGTWITTTANTWNQVFSSLTTTPTSRWGSDGYSYGGLVVTPNIMSTTPGAVRSTIQISPGISTDFGPQVRSSFDWGIAQGVMSGYLSGFYGRAEAVRLLFSGTSIKTIDAQLYGTKG